MRKGLTLTLSTIVLAIAVSAAFAKGPTIGGVPDVWITQKTSVGAADPTTTSNLFRFNNALNLNGYITVGATDGSQTSATLFWVSAFKNAALDGTPSGDFLNPATVTPATNTIHYQINAKTAVKPTNTAGTAAWTTEINTAAQDASKSDQVKNDLSFRNIRVSAGAGTGPFAAPVKVPANLPAGFVDVQEATLYVTDKTTTPGLDQILVVTLIDGNDRLSGGGPIYATEKDYTGVLNSSTDAWSGFKLVTDWNGAGNGAMDANALVTFSVSAASMTITSPVTQATTNGGRTVVQYGQLAPANGVSVVASKVYRMRATLVSSNAATTTNPSVSIRMNDRTKSGQGELMLTEATTSGPTTTGKTYAAFLWPACDSVVAPQVTLQDGSNTLGATFTASNVIVDSFDPTKLIGANVLTDIGSGAATGFALGTANGQFQLVGPYSFVGMSNVTFTTTGSGSTALVLSCTNSSSSVQGFAAFGTGTLFTTSAASKLVVLKMNVSSSTSGSPGIRMRLVSNGDGSQPYYWIDRNTSGGPSSTAKDYYDIFESNGSAVTYNYFVDAIMDGATRNGDLRINRITVTEYSKPN